jgi:hypothetical protein
MEAVSASETHVGQYLPDYTSLQDPSQTGLI